RCFHRFPRAVLVFSAEGCGTGGARLFHVHELAVVSLTLTMLWSDFEAALFSHDVRKMSREYLASLPAVIPVFACCSLSFPPAWCATRAADGRAGWCHRLVKRRWRVSCSLRCGASSRPGVIPAGVARKAA